MSKETKEADKITEESFQHKYPDWFYPKIICANVNCKYNGFRNACTCPQVKFGFRHLHTTNEGLVDVFECKSYEEDTEKVAGLEELMEFINKHSVYGFTSNYCESRCTLRGYLKDPKDCSECIRKFEEENKDANNND